MNGEHNERILDASLEEVLGGHYPPDLSARILEQLDSQREPIAPPVEVPLVVAERPSRRLQTVRSNRWMYVVAAGLAGIGIALGLWGIGVQDSAWWASLAGNSTDDLSQPGESQQDHRNDLPAFRMRQEQFAGVDSTRNKPTVMEREAHSPQKTIAPTPDLQPDAIATVRKQQRIDPSPDGAVIAFINQVLADAWDEHSVTPSPQASDRQWYRRAYLALTGLEPADRDVERFVRDRSPEKRRQSVDQWLESEAFAEHWARVWGDALVPATTTTTGPEQALQAYLRQSLETDKPFDQVVAELLTANGSTDPTQSDYNPATGFLAANSDHHAVAATNRISRVLLGKQLMCTRCHAEPNDQGDAGEFWALNAFLRQLHTVSVGASDNARLADVDFFGRSGAGADAEVFYKLARGQLGLAYPELEGRSISRSGLLKDVNRRQELARLVIESPNLARATVNRVWAALLGVGFTQPVDDMGTHNPPAHPELLERLADEFVAHDYDLSALVRWVVLSTPFGLSQERTPESWIDAPELGARPLFARYYGPSDNGPSVYRSLLAVVDSKQPTLGHSPGTLARRSWTEPRVGNLQIIAAQPDLITPGTSWLDQLANSRLRPEQKIEHVFLSVLNRQPTSSELTASKLVLADRFDDAAALREIRLVLVAYDGIGNAAFSK